MTDATNPSHYKDGWSNGAEVIDITEHLSSNGGQAVQYIVRSTRLDGNNKGDVIEDLSKARWFIERELYRLGEGARDPILDFQLSQEVPESAAFFMEHMTQKLTPRVWQSLHEVPLDVDVVDGDKDHWRFIDDQWEIRYDGDSTFGEYDLGDGCLRGPYTEVLEGE